MRPGSLEDAMPDLVELLHRAGEVAHAGEGVVVVTLRRNGADLLECVEVHRRREVDVDNAEQPERHLIVVLAHALRAAGVEAAEVAGEESDGVVRHTISPTLASIVRGVVEVLVQLRELEVRDVTRAVLGHDDILV